MGPNVDEIIATDDYIIAWPLPGSAIGQHLVQPCRPGGSQRLFDAAVLRDHRSQDGQLQALGRRWHGVASG